MRVVMIDLDVVEKIICDKSTKEVWEYDEVCGCSSRKWYIESKEVLEILRNNAVRQTKLKSAIKKSRRGVTSELQ